jgi:4-hydroxy-3-polyprenylbenzoate decarboxylase
MKLVVAVGGASGAIYARRLLDFLAAEGPARGVSVDLVFTEAGELVWRHELEAAPSYPFPVWSNRDLTAPFASGSARYDAMAVVPCSAAGLARIAHGVSADLVGRAADVMLKERRRLVLCLREAPLSLVHARAVAQATEAGAVVVPASPSFYGRPRSVEELADTVVSRLLDRLDVPNELIRRWDGLRPGARAEPVGD